MVGPKTWHYGYKYSALTFESPMHFSAYLKQMPANMILDDWQVIRRIGYESEVIAVFKETVKVN